MKTDPESVPADPLGIADDWQNLCLGIGLGAGALGGGLIGFAFGAANSITGAAIGAAVGTAIGFMIGLRKNPAGKDSDELAPPELDFLPDTRRQE